MANVLNVPHFPQITDGGCLPACAQMVLVYLGEEHSQAVLARQLGTRPNIGTPHRNINRLRSTTIDVRYAAEGTADILRMYLAKQLPDRGDRNGCMVVGSRNAPRAPLCDVG